MVLSPVAIDPHGIELPFGLRWDDVGPVLPVDWDPPSATGPRLVETHRTVGIRGDGKTIVASVVHTAGGRPVQLPLFLKQGVGGEARTHRFLADAGVPTTRLLAAVGDVMVLEQLARIGVDPASVAEGGELLRALAALNAVPWVEDEPAAASTDVGPVTDFDRGVEAALHAAAPSDAATWFDLYLQAQPARAGYPVGTVHGQLWFQQVGWADRDGGPELVLFDWASVEVGPRFDDVANVCAELAVASGRSEREVLAVFVDAARLSLDLDEALDELRVTRFVSSCWTLPWLVADHPDDHRCVEAIATDAPHVQRVLASP